MSKAERTRAFIIEKTAPIFNKKGFAGTSLNDITAATGLTKGSIYGNFANKDEVALAVFDYNFKKVGDAINAEVLKQTGARNKLLAYAECYEGLLLPPFTAGGCPVLNTAIEADDTHPELRKKAISAVLSWKVNLMKIINQGIENKEFNQQTNAEDFAITFISMIEGAVMITKLLDDATPIKTVMQQLKKIIEELN